MRVRVFVIAIVVLCFAAAGHAGTELHKEHSFSARPGGKVVIDVSFHGVEVTARPGDTVDVTVDLEVKGSGNSAKKALDELQPKFLEEGNKLVIRSVRKGGFSWKSLSAKGRVVVQMPPDMDLLVDASSGSAKITGDFGNSKVVFDASSGSLTVKGAMRELHSDVSSGSTSAEVTRPLEAFSADASSGSVRLNGGADTATVDTSSGSITLAGLRGSAKFDASSGSIKAQWDTIPADATVIASASSGSVTLSFPAGTVLSGSADTSSGGIRTDFPGTMEKSHLTLSGGAGAVRVRVDTSSGGVRLIAE